MMDCYTCSSILTFPAAEMDNADAYFCTTLWKKGLKNLWVLPKCG